MHSGCCTSSYPYLGFSSPRYMHSFFSLSSIKSVLRCQLLSETFFTALCFQPFMHTPLPPVFFFFSLLHPYWHLMYYNFPFSRCLLIISCYQITLNYRENINSKKTIILACIVHSDPRALQRLIMATVQA